MSIRQCIFPDKLKTADIIPCHKKDDTILKVENFAGTKFRRSKEPRNFCVSRVLNFAVAPSK